MLRLLEKLWPSSYGSATERVQMRVSPEEKRKLNELQEKTGAKSVSEVMSWGLGLLDFAFEQTRKREGAVLISEMGDYGRFTAPIVFPWQEEDEPPPPPPSS